MKFVVTRTVSSTVIKELIVDAVDIADALKSAKEMPKHSGWKIVSEIIHDDNYEVEEEV